MSEEVRCRTSPSLALVKYWGKKSTRKNLPATPSLAVTLGGVYTETGVRIAERDSIRLNGENVDLDRFLPLFAALRRAAGRTAFFQVETTNNFPSSAGLASSSSGFAALTIACARILELDLAPERLSALARLGSASAARSLFGGFTLLPAGGRAARQLYEPEYWPEFRIVIVLVSLQAKPISSRAAMEGTRKTSPYYRAWLHNAGELLQPALRALQGRDIDVLGDIARLSYSRMHAALLASSPPVLYWLPSTISVIRECQHLRDEGIGAWETLDAGPQVKVLCLQADVDVISQRLQRLDPEMKIIVAPVGPGPVCE
ncbi:MAG: diphosphomevalonate decarboxylase [Spirochaetaceae bacterium]|nr:MAG: diphosphomevalonate decarboxylase [Spirochaetaceae bacterium]